MIFWADAGGHIVQAALDDGATSPWDDDPSMVRVTAPSVPDINAYYVDGGAVCAKPARPSISHEFDYGTKAWVADIPQAWAEVRRQRDRLLTATDWVVLRAADTGQPVPPEWLAYRQALRDITKQADPLNIVWPEPPV